VIITVLGEHCVMVEVYFVYKRHELKTLIYNSICETCFWNDLHQAHST